MTQVLTLPNLSSIRNEHPGLYDDMRKLQGFLNTITQKFGGYSALVLNGQLTVNGANGIIDVQIKDNNPRSGEEYFLEYSTSPSFVSVQVESLVPSRTKRFAELSGLTTYWRAYKSTKLGGVSNFLVYGGNSPIGVTPGGTAGPPISSGGSGSSGGGGGYGGGGGGRGGGGLVQCVMKGTKLKGLGGPLKTKEFAHKDWITVLLGNGMRLSATEDQLLMTENGKTRMGSLQIGEQVVTIAGMSQIQRLAALRKASKKVVVQCPGDLYLANGILAHA